LQPAAEENAVSAIKVPPYFKGFLKTCTLYLLSNWPIALLILYGGHLLLLQFYIFSSFAKLAMIRFVPTLSNAISNSMSLPIGVAPITIPTPNAL